MAAKRSTSSICLSPSPRKSRSPRIGSTLCPIPTTPRAKPPFEAHADIRLVAIDIDGTLLRSDKRLSRTVARTVTQAAADGVHIVLATARPPRSVRQVYELLGLRTPQINYNGALIHDEPRNRTILHQPVPAKLGQQVIRYARRLDPQVVVSVEILDKWYTDHVDESLPTETSREFHPDFVGPLESFTHKAATKIMFLAPPQRLGKLKAALHDKFGHKVAILICDSHLIQVIHRKVDKAAALEYVAQLMGVARQQVMAIGDAPNDERMLRWAGLGVALRNAWPQVQAAAKVVMPSNDDDGVAAALKRFVL